MIAHQSTITESIATSATRSRPRIDTARIEAAVREILYAVGEDPGRDGLVETPARVARAYSELLGGLAIDPGRHLARTFEHSGDELVYVGGIDLASMCEHHLLPFFGKASVAYLPRGGRVVGLSKLARTVDVLARRPQVQERLTGQIADALVEHLDPAGVFVAVRAEHLCMRLRGVRSCGAATVTFAERGVLATDSTLRGVVMEMAHRDCRNP